MDLACAHIHIRGHVQGVGFRYCAKSEAERLGLTGWVRNVGFDQVEAVFEGPRADVDAAVAWCREGPDGSRVDDVVVTWAPPEGGAGFSFRPSSR
jgi:acylphosphatase